MSRCRQAPLIDFLPLPSNCFLTCSSEGYTCGFFPWGFRELNGRALSLLMRRAKNSAVFMGQLGHGFASRLAYGSVLSYLSREGIRSDTGAAADLRTSLPIKASTFLYHSCRGMLFLCTSNPFCCSAAGSGLRMFFASFSSVSQACFCASPGDKLLIHRLGSKATAPFTVQVPSHLQWQQLGGVGWCSFYMYAQIINNGSLIPRRAPVSSHIS